MPDAGTKPLRDASSAPDPVEQGGGIELGSITSSIATEHEAQPQPRPQEASAAVRSTEAMSASTNMSLALPLVNHQKGEEVEMKSPAFPPETKLKSQMPESKVLRTWWDLRETYL